MLPWVLITAGNSNVAVSHNIPSYSKQTWINIVKIKNKLLKYESYFSTFISIGPLHCTRYPPRRSRHSFVVCDMWMRMAAIVSSIWFTVNFTHQLPSVFFFLYINQIWQWHKACVKQECTDACLHYGVLDTMCGQYIYIWNEGEYRHAHGWCPYNVLLSLWQYCRDSRCLHLHGWYKMSDNIPNIEGCAFCLGYDWLTVV